MPLPNEEQAITKPERRRDWVDLDNLATFVRVCNELDASPSRLPIGQIAEQIDLNAPTLNSVLKGLAERYRGALLETTRFGETRLSALGKQCRTRFLRILRLVRRIERGLRPAGATDDTPTWVHPSDLAMYCCIAEYVVKVGKPVPLQDVIRGISAGAGHKVKGCIERLTTRYGPLLIQDRAQGISGLTPAGTYLLTQSQKLLPRIRDLEKPRIAKDISIRVASTNVLRLGVLPGAMGAFILRLADEFKARNLAGPGFPNVRILLEEGNYPRLVEGVRRGHFPFAIGWELSADSFADLKQSPLTEAPVPFLLVMGVRVVRQARQVFCHDDRSRQNLMTLESFAQTSEANGPSATMKQSPTQDFSSEPNHDEIGLRTTDDPIQDTVLFEPDQLPQIPFADASRLLRTLTVAVIKTEYRLVTTGKMKSPGELVDCLDLTSALRVNNYEDVFTTVRQGLADVGWVPAFYRSRRFANFAVIQDVGRRVVYYSKQRSDSDSLPSSAAARLLETIQAFLNEPKFQNRIIWGMPISPDEVQQWTKSQVWKAPIVGVPKP